MPLLRKTDKRGDIFVHVKLVFTDSLNEQEISSIAALAFARQTHAEPGEVRS